MPIRQPPRCRQLLPTLTLRVRMELQEQEARAPPQSEASSLPVVAISFESHRPSRAWLFFFPLQGLSYVTAAVLLRGSLEGMRAPVSLAPIKGPGGVRKWSFLKFYFYHRLLEKWCLLSWARSQDQSFEEEGTIFVKGKVGTRRACWKEAPPYLLVAERAWRQLVNALGGGVASFVQGFSKRYHFPYGQTEALQEAQFKGRTFGVI